MVLDGRGARQQLVVLAGGRDVTGAAQFQSSKPRIAAVSRSGVVTPVGDGSASIEVRSRAFPGVLRVPVSVKNAKLAAASFRDDIVPLLNRAGCNSSQCHGARAGKGGLTLSLFGGDPDADFDALTRSGAGRRVDKVAPAESLLLLKATGALEHKGGARITPGSAEHETVVAWLQRGAPRSAGGGPVLSRLEIAPAEVELKKGESRQFLLTAVFSDGSRRDVTAFAQWSATAPEVVTVGRSGRVTAASAGESAIVASYARAFAVANVVSPFASPRVFPALKSHNRVDDLVGAKLKRLGLPPSELCTDEEFLRRVWLDVTGVLPPVAEARAWLAEKSADKRARLIDRLLASEEYVDFQVLKWADLLRIKSEYPVRLWPKAVAVYHRWVRESVAANKPYDRFVRELLTANGSNFRSGPANFVRANSSKDPQTIGETSALLFLGIRLGCARCHAHPSCSWTPEDNLAFGAFFSKVRFKSTLEWKEEIVYPDPGGVVKHPKTRAAVAPRFPDGTPAAIAGGEDPRQTLARWITAPENPWFARNIVNRIWFWLFGAGIVHEPDDLRATNPPENPALLDYLAGELVTHGYDLKHIYRLILNSRTYQLSARPNEWNAGDRRHFSHRFVRRLTAEQLLDAVSQVTETSEKVSSKIPEPFSFWPASYRAAEIEDGNAECSFLDLFGRPPRDTPYERERNSETSMRQALYLLNSEQLAAKLAASPRIRRMAQSQSSDAALIEELYLAALSRYPTAEEKQKLSEYLARAKGSRAEAVQDVFWAVLNTKEFLFAH